MDLTLNPDLLRLPPTPITPPGGKGTKPPRHKPGERFLKGPIPRRWLERAAQQPGKALHVAVELWFWAGIKNSREVSLSISKMSVLGVKRDAGYRGLAALEETGLVSVVRHRGRKPIVTLLDGPAD